jgi:SAM-dependent methyltransferase
MISKNFVSLKEKLRNTLLKIYHPKGKWAFVATLGTNAKILDVGCGNHSVRIVKSLCPSCIYTGIDIGDYNLTSLDKDLMDNYIIAEPEVFSTKIGRHINEFNVVISSHNLEHVNDRNGTLQAMLKSIKDGGKIYLSFPSEATVNLPSRRGTLNYFDDASHQGNPPNFEEVINLLSEHNFKIDFAKPRYRPVLLFFLGFFLEPLSRFRGKTMMGTWALYGFETVIHATKK